MEIFSSWQSVCFVSRQGEIAMKVFSVMIASILLTSFSQYSFAEDDSSSLSSGGESLAENIQQPDTPFLNVNYFAIFYGPSVGNPTFYQPDLSGQPDHDHPWILRNFATFSHNFSDEVTLAGTGYWTWQPVEKQSLDLQDPFLRISYNSLIHSGGFNLYGDFRVHFPFSSYSREINQKLGLQFFQAATYQVDQGPTTLGLYISERANFFGSHKLMTYPGGYYYWPPPGDDLEFYLAPNVYYQLSQKVSVMVLYEMYASHTLGNRAFSFDNGTDLEPGVVWAITPSVMVNPYLNLLTGGRVTLNTTSFGMMFSVNLI